MPSQLLNDVSSYIRARYCHLFLPLLKDKIYRLKAEEYNTHPNKVELQHLQTLYGYCSKLANSDPDVEEVIKYFPLSTKDFPYAIKFPEQIELEFTAQFVNKRQRTLVYNELNWSGLYQSRGNKPFVNKYENHHALSIGALYISRDPVQDIAKCYTIPDLVGCLEDLKMTTRHELQHFMQDVLMWLTRQQTKLNDFSYHPQGIPSAKLKKRDDEVPDAIQDISVADNLRETEFYTRLTDSIETFSKVKSQVPLSLHSLFSRAWVRAIPVDEFKDKFHEVVKKEALVRLQRFTDFWNGLGDQQRNVLQSQIDSETYQVYHALYTENFFQILKDQALGKWQKAVKEFYKAVEL